jgi:hypothetical protein
VLTRNTSVRGLMDSQDPEALETYCGQESTFVHNRSNTKYIR